MLRTGGFFLDNASGLARFLTIGAEPCDQSVVALPDDFFNDNTSFRFTEPSRGQQSDKYFTLALTGSSP